MAISAPTGAPSSEFRLDRVLAGLPEVQDRVVTRRACMVHAWLVVCTRSGSRRRSSFRPRFAASPAHPGGCPTCAGRAAAVRPALRGHAGLWAGLAAKPAPFVWATLGLYASEQGGAKRGQVPRANIMSWARRPSAVAPSHSRAPRQLPTALAGPVLPTTSLAACYRSELLPRVNPCIMRWMSTAQRDACHG